MGIENIWQAIEQSKMRSELKKKKEKVFALAKWARHVENILMDELGHKNGEAAVFSFFVF